MNRKTTKILTIGLLLAFIIGLTPAYADAAVLSWILGNKAVNLQSKLIAFAGVGENTGVNFLNSESENVLGNIQFLQSNSIVAANEPSSTPIKSKKKENRVYIVPASAYSSTKDQTDHTPFITASGTHVREGVIAANFLLLGTVIKIPEIYGDKTFVVEDRMNSRYFYQIDVWFPTRAEAKEFGLKKVKIEIVS